ncbi:MAG: hypothetical protein MUD08_03785 [Cytophagales bacterium]|nr:hypothetical protein [Cytophagales bacterium]
MTIARIARSLWTNALLLWLAACSCYAFGDSLAVVRKRSIKPAADFDQRFSFIGGQPVNIWGYRLGVLVNEKAKIGVGGYFTRYQTQILSSETPDLTREQRLFFGTVFFEPFLFRKEHWEGSIITEAGFGMASIDTRDLTAGSGTSLQARRPFVPIGTGLSLSYKLPPLFGVRAFRWVGLNAMGGYRKTVLGHELNGNYDGFFWSIGGYFFLDRITDDIRQWRRKRRK